MIKKVQWFLSVNILLNTLSRNRNDRNMTRREFLNLIQFDLHQLNQLEKQNDKKYI